MERNALAKSVSNKGEVGGKILKDIFESYASIFLPRLGTKCPKCEEFRAFFRYQLATYLSLKKNYQQYLDNALILKNKIKEEKDILLQINKLKDCDDETLSTYYDSTRRDAQKYEQIKKDIIVRDKRLEQYKYVDPSTDIDSFNYSMLNEGEIKADLKDINSKIEENIKQISSIQTEGAMLDDLLEEKENLLKEYNDKNRDRRVAICLRQFLTIETTRFHSSG